MNPDVEKASQKLRALLHPPPLSAEEAKPIRRDWADIEFVAVYSPTEHRNVVAYFALYEIQGYHKDPTTGQYTVPGFWRKGSDTNADQTLDTSDAEPFMTCSIKWDGCSNWETEESAHICGHEGLDNWHAAMQRIWHWAKELNMDRD